MPAFLKLASEALAARGLLSGLGKTVKDVTSDLDGAVSGVTGGMFDSMTRYCTVLTLPQISQALAYHNSVPPKPHSFLISLQTIL